MSIFVFVASCCDDVRRHEWEGEGGSWGQQAAGETTQHHTTPAPLNNVVVVVTPLH